MQCHVTLDLRWCLPENYRMSVVLGGFLVVQYAGVGAHFVFEVHSSKSS